MDPALEQTIRTAAQGWPRIAEGDDPNTIDVFLQARPVEDALKPAIPTGLPPKGNGAPALAPPNRRLTR
jgi:hypothetical protein